MAWIGRILPMMWLIRWTQWSMPIDRGSSCSHRWWMASRDLRCKLTVTTTICCHWNATTFIGRRGDIERRCDSDMRHRRPVSTKPYAVRLCTGHLALIRPSLTKPIKTSSISCFQLTSRFCALTFSYVRFCCFATSLHYWFIHLIDCCIDVLWWVEWF